MFLITNVYEYPVIKPITAGNNILNIVSLPSTMYECRALFNGIRPKKSQIRMTVCVYRLLDCTPKQGCYSKKLRSINFNNEEHLLTQQNHLLTQR